MERKEIIEEIKKLSDKKYKEFHTKLCPGVEGIIGVRVPKLRNYAKELIKKYKAEEILKQLKWEYYEEIMLKGMIIGLDQKQEIEETIKRIKKFVPKINNWAICDTFCAGLKITKKHKEEMWKIIKEYIKSNQEFEIRFAVVMMLDYYIEEKYLQEIFKICDKINHEGYYVKMAVAWCISICLIKYYNETKSFLKDCNLDDFTYQKSIQKAIESYRITKEQKEELKKMKKNIKISK